MASFIQVHLTASHWSNFHFKLNPGWFASAPLLGWFSSETGPVWHKRLTASFTLCASQQYCCLFSLCKKCWKSTKWPSATSSLLRFVHSARKDAILVSWDDSDGEREQPARHRHGRKTSNGKKLRYAAGRDSGTGQRDGAAGRDSGTGQWDGAAGTETQTEHGEPFDSCLDLKQLEGTMFKVTLRFSAIQLECGLKHHVETQEEEV